MAAKKDTVPVAKSACFTIKRLGSRSAKDFEKDLRRLVGEGYRVSGFQKNYEGVVVQLAKVEDWTIDEVLAEVHEMLETSS